MTKTTSLQPAYILHSRPYRDTSLLLELFTQEQGRISVIAKGAKSPRSRFKGLLQPFVPLLVSWVGKGELMSLVIAESNGMLPYLLGDKLLCGIYINELLMRLLHRYDAHPQLYQAYYHALTELSLKNNPQILLRKFEKKLLMELGYALDLEREAHTGVAINPSQLYYFDPYQGLLRSGKDLSQAHSFNLFSGESLLALNADEWVDKRYLQDAKRLLRLALGRLLGTKPIKSRELFL